jgi:L-ribulose-5-phosphate 3-epimerase
MEVAIHNHPSPCIYASAEVVEKALKGRSPLMGVCADIGHWKRVGEDPLKNLQKLSGRIKVAHLKDLTDKMEDATWNRDLTGKSVRQRAEASAFQRAYLHRVR